MDNFEENIVKIKLEAYRRGIKDAFESLKETIQKSREEGIEDKYIIKFLLEKKVDTFTEN